MALGYKLKNIRVFRGMTQKELGLAVGFNNKTADVRIAQYESGTRVPKEKIAYAIARALKVNPDYLMGPSPYTIEEIIYSLINIDERNIVELEAEERLDKDGDPYRHINISLPHLSNYLAEWFEKKEALKNEEISQEEYYEWKINWPYSTPAYKETFPDKYIIDGGSNENS